MSDIADVPSPGGWLQLYGARVARGLYVGTASVLSALYVFGTLGVNGHVDFQQTGTETGVVLQVKGATQLQVAPSNTFTATGGNVKVGAGAAAGAKYNTGFFQTPWANTGAYVDITLSCGNVPKALPGDVSIVKKTGDTGSGAPIQNLDGITLGTGATFHFGSGFTIVGPQDALKFSTLTTPGSAVDCKFHAIGFPLYGR